MASRESATLLAAPALRAPGAGAAIAPATRLFAFAAGVIILNLFASQPLVGVIGPALGLDGRLSGFVTLSTLSGYAAGLLLLVPLSDLIENKRLIIAMLAINVVALCACAAAPSAGLFLIAAFALGAATSSIQVIVPLAAALAPEAQRGRVIGDVMSGMMIGVLLSRPLASVAANGLGWRGAFLASGALVGALLMLLMWMLPRRLPESGIGYAVLIRSMWGLLCTERVLRVRAAGTAMTFAAFNVFWTTVALLLARPPFKFGATGIALFALAGVGGAIASPLAGRWGDRGWTRPALVGLHALMLEAFVLAAFAAAIAPVASVLALGGLVVAALMLDIGVVGDQTLGRRAINLIHPEARGRINGLYTGLFFVGGAVASALTGFAWTYGGWNAICILAGGFACAALAISLMTLRDSSLD